MEVPHLHRQLQSQLSQWIKPKDHRHLQVFCENVAAILQAKSGSMSHWLPYLSHRSCEARSHMERLSYFMNNPRIDAETFYEPLVRQFLEGWEGMEMTLTLDTSVLWDQYCLIEVCLVWGGRSFALAQAVLEHGSATVGYEDYRPVLERVLNLLPTDCQVTLLADRGFEHGALLRWLREHHWSWCIRAKSDLNVLLSKGRRVAVSHLLAPQGQAYLYPQVTVLEDIECHLATAYVASAQETWAVLSDKPPSLQTFALYGQRFGGIEPHLKDYKSAGFELIRSRLREAQSLGRLLMLLAAATLIALAVAIVVAHEKRTHKLDWHSSRGLSFLQLGLREIQRLCYQHLPLPKLASLPRKSPPPACASVKKQQRLKTRVEFSRVTVFPA